MWIRRITLKNWSCHKDSIFDFSAPSSGMRNVVLVGAKNGAGKTSLLEAITLCLFGVQGIAHLARGHVVSGSDEGNYKKFINNVFHKYTDSLTMSVRIDFVKASGDTLSLERTWHFTTVAVGKRRYKNEKLQIWENGDSIRIPNNEDADEVQRNFIARHFIPPSLVPFFFFDSAQVQRIAHSDQKEQVRNGINGIMGIPILEELKDGLQAYERALRNETKGIANKDIKAVADKLSKLEEDKTRAENILSSLDKDIHSTEGAQGKLLDDFQKMGGESVAEVGQLRQKMGNLDRKLVELRRQLSEVLENEFALALSGRGLLQETSAQLSSEMRLNSWESDKRKGREKFSKFADNLENLRKTLSSPIGGAQWEELRQKIQKAWDLVWHPSPSDIAENIMHDFLSDADREEVVTAFGVLQAGVEISSLREQINATEKEMYGIRQKINTVTGDDEKKAKALKESLEKFREELKELNAKRGDKSREIESLKGDIDARRAEHRRYIEMEKEAAPQLKLAAIAGKSVDMIEKIIGSAYPIHIKEIAKAMRSSYLNMAHKNIVADIAIDDDCTVRLFADDGQEDLREVQPSQGESQIFALALIAAIVAVSKKSFPFVIDTPLGNLDSVHRPNFLKYYSGMENQVIFLSTDEEVRKREFAILAPSIACKAMIEYDAARRHSTVRDGYFPEIDQ